MSWAPRFRDHPPRKAKKRRIRAFNQWLRKWIRKGTPIEFLGWAGNLGDQGQAEKP